MDACRAAGARFEPLAGGVAVARFSPEPALGEAGLIVGNEGRTVLFGVALGLFDGDLDGDSVPDMLELAENLVLFLLPADCVPDATTLCIDDRPGDRRFRGTVRYATRAEGGLEGDAAAVRLGRLGMSKGGLFCFYGPANPEVLVKVLKGCHRNDHFWFYYTAASNLWFTLTVEDTFTNVVKVYANPDLTASPAVTDTTVFATCSTPIPRPPEAARPVRRVDELLKTAS